MSVFLSTFALGFGRKCNKQANYSVEKCNIYRKYAHALEGYVGEILLVGVNYDKKTKIHECAIERIQKNDPLRTKNDPLKTTDEPLKNAKVTERRKQMEILVQTNIRISKEVFAEQLSISVSTIKREMKALGYEWVGHSAKGYWKKHDESK